MKTKRYVSKTVVIEVRRLDGGEIQVSARGRSVYDIEQAILERLEEEEDEFHHEGE